MTTKHVARVLPVVDESVRRLCTRPYHGHPRGCPNYGRRDTCPPRAPLIGNVVDMARGVFVVWNEFDFAAHVGRMRAAHPAWTDRQCACCLYWQGTARRQLKDAAARFLASHTDADALRVLYCPEACGVNVTETMHRVGVELEWPPRRYARQVALIGFAI